MQKDLSLKQDNKTFYIGVLALVLPMTIQNLINVGVQSADVVMLGMVGEKTLSAAALAGQVQFVLMLFIFGLCSGASVLIAQYWGKGDTKTISKVFGLTIRLAFLVSLLFFSAAMIIPETLMSIFTSEQDLIAMGAVYLRYVAPGYLLTAFTNTYFNLIRSVEKVMIAAVVYATSLLVNIGLNAVLIFGLLGFPEMGIAGAALATTLARCVELTIALVYAIRVSPIKIRRSDLFGNHKVLFQDYIHHVAPTTLNELFWGMAIATNSVIIGRMGEAVIAANSVTQVMRQLATVVCFGLANATAVMVGKALGRSQFETAKQYAKRFLKLTVIFGALGSAIILLLRFVIADMMNLSEESKEFLRFALLWVSGYAIGQAWNTTMIVGIFRSGGDTRFGLLADVLSMWCGSILLGALGKFIFGWPVKVIYMVLLSEEYIKIPFTTWRYFRKKWVRNITRDNIVDTKITNGQPDL